MKQRIRSSGLLEPGNGFEIHFVRNGEPLKSIKRGKVVDFYVL